MGTNPLMDSLLASGLATGPPQPVEVPRNKVNYEGNPIGPWYNKKHLGSLKDLLPDSYSAPAPSFKVSYGPAPSFGLSYGLASASYSVPKYR